MKRAIAKTALLIPAAVTLTLSVNACGSDSRDGGAASPSNTHATASRSLPGNGGKTNGGRRLTPAQLKAITEQVKCMRQKGYQMPDPDPTNPVIAPKNVGGKDPEQVNKDSTECAKRAAQSSGG